MNAESATMTRVRVFDTLELLRARSTRQRFAPHAHDEYVFGMVESGAARTLFRGRRGKRHYLRTRRSPHRRTGGGMRVELPHAVPDRPARAIRRP